MQFLNKSFRIIFRWISSIWMCLIKKKISTVLNVLPLIFHGALWQILVMTPVLSNIRRCMQCSLSHQIPATEIVSPPKIQNGFSFLLELQFQSGWNTYHFKWQFSLSLYYSKESTNKMPMTFPGSNSCLHQGKGAVLACRQTTCGHQSIFRKPMGQKGMAGPFKYFQSSEQFIINFLSGQQKAQKFYSITWVF